MATRPFLANPSMLANGPPFGPIETLQPVYSPSTNSQVALLLNARIDKGFFLAEDNEWASYRRNYFQMSACYSLAIRVVGDREYYVEDNDVLQDGLVIERVAGNPERILGFRLGISARVFGSEEKTVQILQHTPKRDKGPQIEPVIKELDPGGRLTDIFVQLPTLDLLGCARQSQDYPERFEGRPVIPGCLSGSRYDQRLSTAQPRDTVVVWERIQFKQATANNGKRRAAQQYFCLVVTIYAEVERRLDAKSEQDEAKDERAKVMTEQGTELVRVAEIKSAALVVRGRSPGHYTDGPGRLVSGRGVAEAVTSGHRYPPMSWEQSRSIRGMNGPIDLAVASQPYDGGTTVNSGRYHLEPTGRMNTVLPAMRGPGNAEEAPIPGSYINNMHPQPPIPHAAEYPSTFGMQGGYPYLPYQIVESSTPGSASVPVAHDLFMDLATM